MNGDKPSYFTSTLSQVAIASVGCYLIGALWIGFKTGDIAPLKWAAEVFGAGYLAARGLKGANGRGTNGVVPESPKPT